MRHRCEEGAALSVPSATGAAASSILAVLPKYKVFNKHVDLAEQEAEAVRVAKAKLFASEKRRLAELTKKMSNQMLLKLHNREEQTNKNLESFNNFSANQFKLSQLEAAMQASSARDKREHDKRDLMERNKLSIEQNAAAFASEQAAAEVFRTEASLLEQSRNERIKKVESGPISSDGENPYLSVLSDSYAEAALRVDQRSAQKRAVDEASRRNADIELEAERAFRQERAMASAANAKSTLRRSQHAHGEFD